MTLFPFNILKYLDGDVLVYAIIKRCLWSSLLKKLNTLITNLQLAFVWGFLPNVAFNLVGY